MQAGLQSHAPLGKAKKKYAPAMFPLYDGYKPCTEKTEVYEEGGITVWKAVMPYFIVAACLLLVGGFFYVRFFVSHPKKSAPVVHTPAASMAKVLPAAARVNPPHPTESSKPVNPTIYFSTMPSLALFCARSQAPHVLGHRL